MSNDTPVSSKVCWACAKPLAEGQLKCLECESWQNWRRYLNLSSTTLALLVALLSVTTALLPALKEFLPKSPAYVSVTGWTGLAGKGSRHWNLELQIRNFGEQSGRASSWIMCSNRHADVIFQVNSDSYLAPLELTKVSYFASVEADWQRYFTLSGESGATPEDKSNGPLVPYSRDVTPSGDFVGMKCRFLLFNTEDVFTQVLEFTVQFEGPIILENAPSLE